MGGATISPAAAKTVEQYFHRSTFNILRVRIPTMLAFALRADLKLKGKATISSTAAKTVNGSRPCERPARPTVLPTWPRFRQPDPVTLGQVCRLLAENHDRLVDEVLEAWRRNSMMSLV